MYGCCGAPEDRVHRPGLDDPAGVHDRDPVARLGQHREVVADQDQRQPELGPQALEQLEDLGLHHHVERRGGLVGDHQRRPARERQRDHHPLALAARELVRVGALDARRQPDGAEQLGDPRRHVGRLRLRLVQPDRRRDLAADALDRVERVHRALEDERDMAPAHELHPALGAAVDVDRVPAVGRVQRDRPLLLERGGQQPHQRQRGRALAAARLPRQPERLAARQRQVDAVDDQVAPRGGP